eukprot:TRINITY_DN794_c0_g1_i1.p1 TRINITY_DN794_c0_g1~~TRINITY_DN794_c0_g1_i1.p1  ORF type:complete len:508 (+),score=110.01 TRINITY_DN794_c0_g1_i1:62-1585(+)
MSLLSVTKEWAAQNQTLVQIDAFAKSLVPWQIILLTAGGTYVASNWASLKLIDWKSVAFGFALNIVEVIPGASGIVEQEKAKIVDEMQSMIDDEAPEHRFVKIPTSKMEIPKVLEKMSFFQSRDLRYTEGQVSGCVFYGDEQYKNFLDAVYTQFSSANLLHADIFKSTRKFEAEVVKMTAAMLHGDDQVCGTMTSGGTESILMAVKVYRDYARKIKGVEAPELIISTSTHPAFDKACHYFGIKLIKVPVTDELRADVKAYESLINRNTIAIVGSAPSFPHGMFDPFADLSDLALKYNIGLHVDACVGGYVFPWAEKLGFKVPVCDFRLPGVTSISLDSHKYGFAQKGCSVILYKNAALRRHQFYSVSDWTGGLYASPSMAGSRPGGVVATAWASLIYHGEEGFTRNTAEILKSTAKMVDAVKEIPGVRLYGSPELCVFSFTSDEMDIFAVHGEMSKKGWHLNAIHRPNGIQVCVTLCHIGHEERFINDLKVAVETVRGNPELSKSGL